ncbi:MAG: hypothetical protein HQL09_06160 [Nitrospirae bacterium]|nr:hypothetical protein [Nitrospirota bacterium]
MNRHILREIVGILKGSPFYGTLSSDEKRTIIRGLAESYEFFNGGVGPEIDRYESGWTEVMLPEE